MMEQAVLRMGRMSGRVRGYPPALDFAMAPRNTFANNLSKYQRRSTADIPGTD
jgi:hypothetical protein